MRDVMLALMVLVVFSQIAIFIYRCIEFYRLKKKSFPNMVGLSAIGTSVLFTTAAGTLMFFFTESGIHEVCQAASWVCLLLYSATKGQLYIFFIERMHIVHKKPSQTRVESPLYIFNVCLLIPFVVMLFVMTFYRVAYIGDDQKCRHGLRRESTLPTFLYDTLFSVYSVAVFVWPLFKSQSVRRSDGLRCVVKKNIIGSIVSTISTLLNGFSLFYQEVQDTDFCLLHCTADVMINVLVMNYLISSCCSSSGSNSKRPQDLSRFNALYRPYKPSSVAHYEYDDSNAMSTTLKLHPIIERNDVTPFIDTTTTDSECLATITNDDDSVLQNEILDP
jgi:hypothetical protein